MLFGKFRIVGKLALLVFVPLLGVVALSVPIIVNRIGAAQDAQRTSETVQLANRVGTAVQQLQLERLLAVGFRLGLVAEPELMVQSAKSVDAVAQVGDRGQPVSEALRRALNGAARLDETRHKILQRTLTPDVIVTEFTQVVTPIINGLALSARADLRTSVGRQVFALEQAMRSDDMMSQAGGYLTAATITQNIGLIGLFSSTLIQIQQVITGAQPYFTDTQLKLYLSVQDALLARLGAQFLIQTATDPVQAVKLLDVKTLFPSLRSVLVLGGFVEKRIAADVTAAVAASRDNALRDGLLVGGGSLVLLLAVIALSIFMARAVARPLRRLTASADRIARTTEAELLRVADDEAESVRAVHVDPLEIAASDEIGDLARAFDRVQSTAARLVERQVLVRRNVAQMFGHVGRRTQNLVGRQLSLIDRLERHETDSDRLGELYRLDHLSSRLRRNASALVVLSGAAGVNEHITPLSLADVVRLALAEIEDYTRVDVAVPEQIEVVPAVLADLTLLLAELMENATTFSPPHTRVVVTADRARGGVRLAIVDRGLGLPPQRMAEENARLTRRERLDLAPTELLGLFVVGRLARRHGIGVALTETPGGGVTAWVELAPAHLAVAASDTAAGTLVPASQPDAGFAQLVTGSSTVRSAPGSQQPFDPVTLARATRTLESGQSWYAFQPVRASVPADGETLPEAEPVYDAEPVYEPAAFQQPVPPRLPEPDRGTPVAGRPPSALTQRAVPELSAPVRPTWSGPSIATPRIPRQRVGASSAAHLAPLVRRVPGATLPQDEPDTAPPATASAQDPEAVRALVDQFEYGVALALQEIQPRNEGQPR